MLKLITNATGKLTLFTLIGTLFLAITQKVTLPLITEEENNARLSLFAQILPQALYNNNLLQDSIILPAGLALHNREDTRIYRARKMMNGKIENSAVLLQAVAPDGYSGDIKVLLAIQENGSVLGVRVLSHRETPGLGDYIDIKLSQWIRQFDLTSLIKPTPQQWQVKKDGGTFEYRAGATITPRAVVKIVRESLLFYNIYKEQLFNLPAEQRLKTNP